jgi:hypothetical protein
MKASVLDTASQIYPSLIFASNAKLMCLVLIFSYNLN